MADMSGSNTSPECSDHSPPSPPSPSQDKGLIPKISPTATSRIHGAPSPPHALDGNANSGKWELSSLEPESAMKLLARCVIALVDTTGDIPPTPPLPIARSLSSQRLSVLVDPVSGNGQATGNSSTVTTGSSGRPRLHRRTSSRPGTPVPSHDIHRSNLSHLIVGTPEAAPDELSVAHADDMNAPSPTTTPRQNNAEEEAAIANERNMQMLQQQTIARKFFCKTPPPVTIDVYLARLQQWCPMSTAVYLAAACYICKLCIEDRVVPATSRTAHRLLLASLRVAMKALEDLRYPQDRFAIVGGVKQEELRQLEISLCYLMDFELQITKVSIDRRVGCLLQIARMRSTNGRKGNDGKENGMPLKLPVKAMAKLEVSN